MIPSIARIQQPGGRTVGTGFAVDARGLIVTCAHVVTGAGGAPGGAVRVSFPAAGVEREATVEPAWWRAVEDGDIAVLSTGGPLPDGVHPLPLARVASPAGRSVSTFGYPAARGEDGMWGYGRTGDLLPGENGRLQLRDAPEITQGYSGAPLVDQASGRVVGMVSSITRPDRFGRQTTTVFATPVEAVLAACPVLQASEECPYRSLLSFGEEHVHLFFGRDRDKTRMLEQLRRQPRFLAVLGPSGSGKSSLLHAGLVAALRTGAVPGSARWDIISTRVTENGALATDELARDKSLVEACRQWLAARPESVRCVLIVDQLEELFVTVPPAPRAAVLEQLADLPDADLPVTLVLAMRDDFYSRLAREAPRLVEWIERGLVNVGATLDAAALRAMVEQPAHAVGLELEDGLADVIVRDAIEASGPGPGAQGDVGAPSTVLPLLEFALTQLWELRDGSVLTHSAYRSIGGVTGGLTQWADEAYHRLDPARRALARRVFTGLVHLGDEALGVPDSRWRRPVAALCRDGDDPAEVEAVIRDLTTARLLVAGQVDGEPLVELIHDSLLREWAMLSGWLAEDRRFLTWRQELDHRLAAWQGSAPEPTDRDEGRLLHGRDLDTAAESLADRPDDLSAAERDYIRASLDARQQMLDREGALRAEAETQRRLASRSETAVRLRQEALRAVELLDVDPVAALLAAVETVGRNLADLPGEPLGPVQYALHTALHTAAERCRLDGFTAAVQAVAISPDGNVVVAGSDDRTLRIWDAEGTVVAGPLTGHEDSVRAIAFHPDGTRFVSAGADLSVRLWDASGAVLAAWPGEHAEQISVASFSPDGTVLATGADDGTVRERGLEDPGDPRSSALGSFIADLIHSPDGRFSMRVDGTGQLWLSDAAGPVRDWASGHRDYCTAAAFTPDGALIVSTGRDDLARLWTLDGRPAGALPVGHHNGALAMTVGPDGHTIVTGAEDGLIRLTDRQGLPVRDPLRGHSAPVTALALSRDGSTLVTGAADRTIRIWDLRDGAALDQLDPAGAAATATGPPPVASGGRNARNVWDRTGCQLLPAWRGHREVVWAVEFSPDGARLASAGDDRTIQLWDLHGHTLGEPLVGHGLAVTGLSFSPDGRLLASSSGDGGVRVWEPAAADPGWRPPLTGHTDRVLAVAFSPDGTGLASASLDGTVRRWHLAGDGRALASLSGHEGAVTSVAFSPDGHLLASGGTDGTVRLWTLDGRQTVLRGHTGAVRSVQFDPAGGTLVTGSDDRTVRLWPLAPDAAEPVVLRGHGDSVRATRFSGDGQLVVSGSADCTVRLWDRDGDAVARPFHGHAVGVTSVAVRPGGGLLASGGADATVRIWSGGTWRDWLRGAGRRLRHHPAYQPDGPAAQAVAQSAPRS